MKPISLFTIISVLLYLALIAPASSSTFAIESEDSATSLKKVIDDKEEAKRIADELAELKYRQRKKNEILSKGYYKIGVNYYKKDQYAAAVTEFQKALTFDPTNSKAARYLKKAHEKLAKHRARIQRDLIVKERKRDVEMAKTMRMTEEEEAQLKAQRERDLKKKIKMPSEAALMREELLKESHDLYDNGNYRAAEEALNLALEYAPFDEELIYYREKTRNAIVERKAKQMSMAKSLEEMARLAEVDEATVPTPGQDVEERYGDRRTSSAKRLGAQFATAKQEEVQKVSSDRENLKDRLKERIAEIDFTDASIKDVIKFLVDLTGLNFVMDEGAMPSAERKISVSLRDMPISELLDIVLYPAQLDYDVKDNYILVASAARIEQGDMVVKVYDVQDLVGNVKDYPAEQFDASVTTSKKKSSSK